MTAVGRFTLTRTEAVVTTHVIYRSGTSPATDNTGTIAVVPNTQYWVQFEILRNDLGNPGEYVLGVSIGGVNMGACYANRQHGSSDYDCTFYECYAGQNPVTVSSSTGNLAVNIRLTGHSWDCDCDTSTWDCSSENSIAGRTRMTAVGRFTLTRYRSVACAQCSAGRADTDSNPATACSACQAGTYAAAGGATACSACQAGRYAAAGGTTWLVL